jgi:ankyrin repeat protein
MPETTSLNEQLLVAIKNKNLTEIINLLDSGADPNCCDYLDGVVQTPLSLACMQNDLESIKLLISKRTSINLTFRNCDAPLIVACYYGYFEIVKYLVEQGADIFQTNIHKRTPFIIALSRGYFEIADYLLLIESKMEHGREDYEIPILNLLKNENFEAVDYLKDKGYSIDIINKDGDSSLLMVCQSGSYKAVKYLVGKGASIGVTNKNNSTPIELAYSNKHFEIVDYLISQGAKITFPDNDTQHLLFITAENNYLYILKQLVAQGVSINQIRKSNLISLAYSYDYINTIDYANVMARSDGNAITSSGYKILSKVFKKASKGCSNRGESLFIIACRFGRLEIIRYLIEQKVQINQADGYGWTPLHIACKYRNIELVKLLLQNRADINIKTNRGETALQISQDEEYFTLVTYLKNFKQPLPFHIQLEPESYVIVRVWTPKVNKTDSSYTAVMAKKSLAKFTGKDASDDSDVGHISLAIYQNGEQKAYISHWPKKDAYYDEESEHKKSNADNNSFASDMACEQSLPSYQIRLYSLDIEKILVYYRQRKPNLRYDLYGTAKKQVLITGDEAIVHNCSSLIYELLEIGGLFEWLLKDSEKISITPRPVTPLLVGELAQKARAVEDILYPETKAFAENYLKFFETEFKEKLRAGYSAFIEFLRNHSDSLWLYAKQYGVQGMTALITLVETNLPRAEAALLLGYVKNTHEQDPLFKGGMKNIIQEKLKGLNVHLNGLLKEIGYRREYREDEPGKLSAALSLSVNSNKTIIDETFITLNNQFYRGLVLPFLEALVFSANKPLNLNWADEQGYQAIHWAVINNSPTIVDILLTHCPQAVNAIISYQVVMHNANQELATASSNKNAPLPLTPLDLAYEQQLPELVKILRDKGGLTQAELRQHNNQLESSNAQLLTRIRARDIHSILPGSNLLGQGHETSAVLEDDINNNSNRNDLLYRSS